MIDMSHPTIQGSQAQKNVADWDASEQLILKLTMDKNEGHVLQGCHNYVEGVQKGKGKKLYNDYTPKENCHLQQKQG